MATPSSFIVIYNVELSTTDENYYINFVAQLKSEWTSVLVATRAYSIQFEFLCLNGIKE